MPLLVPWNVLIRLKGRGRDMWGDENVHIYTLHEFDVHVPILRDSDTGEHFLTAVFTRHIKNVKYPHGFLLHILKAGQTVGDSLAEGNYKEVSQNGKTSIGPDSLEITTDGGGRSYVIWTEPVSFYTQFRALNTNYQDMQRHYEAATGRAATDDPERDIPERLSASTGRLPRLQL
jgi:hypothetical protein